MKTPLFDANRDVAKPCGRYDLAINHGMQLAEAVLLLDEARILLEVSARSSEFPDIITDCEILERKIEDFSKARARFTMTGQDWRK